MRENAGEQNIVRSPSQRHPTMQMAQKKILEGAETYLSMSKVEKTIIFVKMSGTNVRHGIGWIGW